MTRIALTHVAYDARRACFHARAVVDGRPAVDCRWSGPQSADFDRVAVENSAFSLLCFIHRIAPPTILPKPNFEIDTPLQDPPESSCIT